MLTGARPYSRTQRALLQTDGIEKPLSKIIQKV